MQEAAGLLSALPQNAGREGLTQLWTVLPEARLVGGCVRDLLCGRALHDFDLATPEPPEVVLQRLKKAGLRAVPTGLEHGTVTAVINRVPYEITTLRRDAQTDGRHAVVEWTSDWAEDAARRDFTINAMSLDQYDCLHDYFGGQDDLAAGRVRFVGDAGRRIEEDALRALRFFRFEARYGAGMPDHEALTAITERASLVASLSVERVASELLRILAGPDVVRIVRLMHGAGVLAQCGPVEDAGCDVLTGVGATEARLRGGLPAGVTFLEALLMSGAPAQALLRLRALYGERSEALARHLKLSNAEKQHLKLLGESSPDLLPTMDDDAVRRARFVQDVTVLLERSWLLQAQSVGVSSAEWDGLREHLEDMSQPVFPLSGRDAREAGIEPGPSMGVWLRTGQAWWLEQGCRPDRDACLAYLRAKA
nr:CCA tRNA nucleotidyltransferase [uncultured Neokomagataea sp.]